MMAREILTTIIFFLNLIICIHRTLSCEEESRVFCISAEKNSKTFLDFAVRLIYLNKNNDFIQLGSDANERIVRNIR